MNGISRASSDLYSKRLIPDSFSPLGGQQIDRVVDDTTSQVSLLRGSSNGDDYVRYQIVSELRARGVTNYCDFYFLSVTEFKGIIESVHGGPDLFKKLAGKNISEASVESKEFFGKSIGFERMSADGFRLYISKLLSENGVSSIDELRIFGVKRFNEIFGEDNIFRYFFMRMIKKDIGEANLKDLLTIGDYLLLEPLSDNELKTRMRPLFSNVDRGIFVKNFLAEYGDNLLVRVYFYRLGKWNNAIGAIHINLLRSHIEGLFDYLGFADEVGTSKEKERIFAFLRDQGIFNYDDFEKYGVKVLGPILSSNRLCREVLRRFGLREISNFNLEYFKRLCRYVGVDGVPENTEYDISQTKHLLLRFLSNNGVYCLYSLRHMGVKGFVRNIKKLPIETYRRFDSFVKKITGKSLTCIDGDDLESIGVSLGLIHLTEQEHKSKLLQFFSQNSIDFSSLTITYLRTTSKLYKNPNFRYLLETLYGITNILDVRNTHLKSFISYLSN